MTEVDRTYKEMWANGTWTPEYKDPLWWPQCCGYPMARHNELSRRGHRCYICLQWRCESTPRQEQEEDISIPGRDLDQNSGAGPINCH